MGFLSTVLKRATPENPSFSLNSPEAFDAFSDGRPASSGVRVNAETALTYSPWWRGLNLIARTVGRVPLNTFTKAGKAKTLATKHPAYFLLRRKPNPYQTAYQFRMQLTGHAASRGNGYAMIDRVGQRPTGLWPLDPSQVTIVKEPAAKKLWYVVTPSDGSSPSVKLDSTEILHVRGFSSDGICGLSVVDKAREHLGLGMGGVKYQSIFFKNGARPSVLLETPQAANEKVVKEVQGMWDRMNSGLDNMHRTAILWNGLKANTLSFSADDSKIIETRNISARDVANFLGLPIHKVGDTSRTAYASLEQENMSCLDDAYEPWLTEWECECWDKLLTEDEKRGDQFEIEFDRDRLVQGDSTARANYFRTALGGAPWMTRNEVRGEEGLDPVEGGDEIIDPKNMGQGGADNQPTNPADSNVKPEGANVGDEAARAVIADAERRARKRVAVHAERAAKTPRKFLEWIDGLVETHGEALRAILLPAYSLTDGNAAERVNAYVSGLQAELLEVSGSATGAGLVDVVRNWGEGD